MIATFSCLRAFKPGIQMRRRVAVGICLLWAIALAAVPLCSGEAGGGCCCGIPEEGASSCCCCKSSSDSEQRCADRSPVPTEQPALAAGDAKRVERLEVTNMELSATVVDLEARPHGELGSSSTAHATAAPPPFLLNCAFLN